MEKWTIDLWVNSNGVCYVEKDLLEGLGSKDRQLLKNLLKKIDTLTRYTIEHLKSSELIENIGDDLWELKFNISPTKIRYLGCISHSTIPPTFYVLCAFKKKDQRIRNKYINLAQNRQKEFKISNKNEPQRISTKK